MIFRKILAAAVAVSIGLASVVLSAAPASADCAYHPDLTDNAAPGGNWYSTPGNEVPAVSDCDDVNLYLWNNSLIENQQERFKGQYFDGHWTDGAAGQVLADEHQGAYRVVISNVQAGTFVRQVTINDLTHSYEWNNYVYLAI